MASLFSRRGTPFILDGDKPGKILDLRIHWTAAEKMVSAPTGIDLDPGESNLASVTHAEGSSIFSLVFYGRHPLLEDVYFTTTVDLDTTIPADYIPYITESGSYQVQTAGGSYILYTVLGSDVSENADISMCVQNPRVVILVDLTDNASSWVSEDSDTGTVEPFNVIFDYLPASVEQLVPKFVDQFAGSATIESSYFTNNPVQMVGETFVSIPTAHRFSIDGNTLSFIDLPAAAEPAQKILSINGVTADHGGITIKILP